MLHLWMAQPSDCTPVCRDDNMALSEDGAILLLSFN